jgi:hypothetical protein
MMQLLLVAEDQNNKQLTRADLQHSASFFVYTSLRFHCVMRFSDFLPSYIFVLFASQSYPTLLLLPIVCMAHADVLLLFVALFREKKIGPVAKNLLALALRPVDRRAVAQYTISNMGKDLSQKSGLARIFCSHPHELAVILRVLAQLH